MKLFSVSFLKRNALAIFASILLLLGGVWLIPRGRAQIEAEYKAQGFQMMDGCNGGAANHARGQVHTIEQLLEAFRATSDANTNVIVQLQKAYTLAKEKAQVLRADCGKRGHCENKPWKSEWAEIQQALAASEKELFER